jgi:flagellar hook-basal body complex protein FliE
VAISTAELVGKVKGVQQTSENLSAMTGSASRDLTKSANTLAALTRGSRSGEEATVAAKTASDSLNKASLSLKALCRSCDEFIQNAVK